MNTKLTLTLEKEVIEQTKKYASNNGRSLSELVENYFKYLTETEKTEPTIQISPRVQKLQGVMKVDTDFNYKEVLDQARNEKHGI